MYEKNDQKMLLEQVARHKGNSLKRLLEQADLHLQSEQQVLAAIPEELAGGARFVSCQNGELVLSTDNASKATRLRFRQHEVMAALREYDLFRFVWKIKIKVVPARFQPVRRRQMTPLSKENARLLKEEAGHTKDKALREVLEKLASHARN